VTGADAEAVARYAELLDELEGHERELVFPRFDEELAWQLGSELVRAAREDALPVAIAIRRNGQRLFHAALPGASADNDAWLERKAAVVDRYGRSSFLIGTRFRSEGKSFEEASRLDPDRYAAHGGAFPLNVAGAGVIGTIAVSGLPQAEDHRFVVTQLRAFLARPELVLPGA
jgi:uncharacterized protein (UPF0303 family)